MPKNKELYTSKFTGTFKAVKFEDLEKLGISKASLISEASSILPEEFDVEKNPDVLPVVFNLGLVNRFNENGDAIDASSAAKILKQFKHKPINIEHKKQYIIGHIVNASFSDKQPDFNENDPMEYIERKDPFYITAAGLIYKHVYPELAAMLSDASDPESPYHKAYSTSWEISFTDYKVAIGSKDLESCSVYDSTSEEFKIYKENLKSVGGTGNSNKGPVGRLFAGEKFPLGCALTENPAAEVEGVYTLASLVENGAGKSYEDNSSINKKTSKNNKKVVKQTSESLYNMTDEQFNEFKALVQSLSSDKTEESQASNAMKQIQDVLKDAGTEWKSKAEVSAEKAELAEKELADLKDSFSKASDELKSLKEDLEVKNASERFNSRMNAIASTFELTEDEEKIVSDEVRSLGDEDEAFDAYVAKAKVIFNHRTKEAIAAAKEKEDKSEDSSDLEGEDESKANILNNNGDDSQGKTLIDRLKETGLELVK